MYTKWLRRPLLRILTREPNSTTCVRRFARSRARTSTSATADGSTWRLRVGRGGKRLAELGLLGIAVPERFGGSGAGLVEQAIVCEELARELGAPPGIFRRRVWPPQRFWHRAMTLRAPRCCPAWSAVSGPRRSASPVPPPPETAVRGASTRRCLWCPTARMPICCWWSLTVPTARRCSWCRMTTASCVTVCSRSIRRGHWRTSHTGARARPDGVPRSGDQFRTDVRLRATALLAAEQATVAGHCVDVTRQYLLDRRHFGRRIGAFQALKHRFADAAVCAAPRRTSTSSRPRQRILPGAEVVVYRQNTRTRGGSV